jgi:MFS family permease
MVQRLFEGLLSLYPPRFRSNFSSEIRVILSSRMREAEQQGRTAPLAVAFQEFTALVISILRERWHELRVRKEKKMAPEDQLQNDVGTEGGGIPTLWSAGAPGALWVTGWALLTTAAIPAALIATAPLAVIFLWLINLGVNAGFWPTIQDSYLAALGFITAFALVLASVQWFLLRRLLPRAGLWFIATGAGVLLGGLVAGLFLVRSSGRSWDPLWLMAAVLLPVGLFLGLAQWLYLRRYLPNSFWIIIIDVLAAASILLAGRTLTSLAEVVVLLLPGAITGLGMWLLLSQSRGKIPDQVQIKAPRENNRRFPRLVWIGLGLVALVPLFFACSLVYSASQLALAKNAGIYSSPEEGMRALAQKSYPPDHQVKILSAGPNAFDGSLPHIWYVIAEVRASSRSDGSAMGRNGCDAPGSFFIQTRDGWVHVSEGAFPEFIGFWMKVFGWAGEGQSTPSTKWSPGQPSRFCQ